MQQLEQEDAVDVLSIVSRMRLDRFVHDGAEFYAPVTPPLHLFREDGL